MATLNEIENIAAILGACQRGAKVAWADDGETAGVAYGTARHVCRDESGAFAHGDAEPEGLLVRITTVRGFEVFESLTALATAYGEGLFVLDPS
jgi:hypothetical protein